MAVVALEVARGLYSKLFYQEIDFHCYKEFGERLWQQQDFDYGNYECDFGPMYYPAGFAFTYAFLMFVTHSSLEIMLNIHVAVLAACSFLSYRLFSPLMPSGKWVYFVTPLIVQCVYRAAISRVTNDLHQSLVILVMLFAIKNRWFWVSSLCYTFAVAYKMNALFFGPALLFIYVLALPLKKVFAHFAAMGIVQVLIPLPFLLHHPWNYLRIAFNFGRDFESRVNMHWGFLGDSIRYDPSFYTLLLAATLVSLTALFIGVYYRLASKYTLRLPSWSTSAIASKDWSSVQFEIMMTMVAANFIGYSFSRGAHIQFFLWIYFTLPFLMSAVAKLPSILTLFFIMAMDWAHSWCANVIMVDAIEAALVSFQIGSYANSLTALGSVFTQLKSLSPDEVESMLEPPISLLGADYLFGYSWRVIPASLVLFLVEISVVALSLKTAWTYGKKEGTLSVQDDQDSASKKEKKYKKKGKIVENDDGKKTEEGVEKAQKSGPKARRKTRVMKE